ncbi:acetyl-CoA carboxylase biotin carboxyl carrier protein [Ruminococcus sp. OA3]|uniref:acetyl-CoA carboxylase biotin carboxyl carrier protein n=1 Tax=Ruminococcus sp. OA3 TaxID=2914164 RepID=UPI001F0704E9|nr:acetyl-CoA carboxylase biotin carboxyl carrier protein [Ruminococcus sp. OA3]
MEAEQIIRLIETVSASSLSEFEYQEGDVKLVLKAEKQVVAAVPAAAAPVAVPESIEETEIIDDGTLIKSPLVGTFYSAPSEDAQAFVQVGDTVKKGQVIGIIETMKLMNEIECDRDGVITGILIENEQVVEYGQPLFRIG